MSTARPLTLSVLDQSPIRYGATAEQALHETLELARRAEAWGYHRFWVSEHHNITSLAGSAPEVLLARLGSVTDRLRLGSGGVMLPNHSALKVAENFRLLEALFPGRIDLGLGRAPGGDRITAALLNPSNHFGEAEFVQQLEALQLFFGDAAGTSHGPVVAIPQAASAPAPWLLTSTGGAATLAARLGMGLAVARFINGECPPAVVAAYRRQFVPSAQLAEPAVLLAISVLCADTEAEARALRHSFDYRLLRLTTHGLRGPQPSPEQVQAYRFSPAEQEIVQSNASRVVSGTPDQVRDQLLALATAYDLDEIMVVTITDSFSDRLRSYQLLAEVIGTPALAA